MSLAPCLRCKAPSVDGTFCARCMKKVVAAEMRAELRAAVREMRAEMAVLAKPRKKIRKRRQTA